MDASRAPEMFFADFPYAYDLEALKRNPDAAQGPPTLPLRSLRERLAAGRRLAAANARIRDLASDVDRQLRQTLFPGMVSYVSSARQMGLPSANRQRLMELWMQHEHQVLDSMGPQLLMPGLVCGIALAELRAFLADRFWEEDPDALAQLIASGGEGAPNRTILADAELYEVGTGNRTLEAWQADHGHRAVGELDLAAAPLGASSPRLVREMALRLAGGENPLERQRQHRSIVRQRVDALRAKLSPRDRAELDRRVDLAQRYVSLREDAKDFLMRGYDLLRDLAREAGRRLGIGEDVFYSSPARSCLPHCRDGQAPPGVIDRRKSAYQR